MLNDVIRYKARKHAVAHVKRALQEIRSDGYEFDYEPMLREIKASYWYQKSVNFTYQTAYDGPWHELGANDALKGWRRFDVPAYATGWRNQIMALAFDGWVNPRIIERHGFIDEVIGQQYINSKRLIDELDWSLAPSNPKNRAG
jgi:hypothetical protein